MYSEIGPGERTALLKLAVQQRETSNRALKIAIDVSIWTFQIRSGKGGTNADLRTLFYRLLRLHRLAIQPLFVFDGPRKPPFKRNKRTNVTGGSSFDVVAKQLFALFGYPYIEAHGEAEAECALLQREGIVDAVLSEDVDTLMFGCTMHLRKWSSEGVKGNKTPTHVNAYYADKIKSGKSGLDREGMVLVALMSGGDYIPAGIPGCGPKVACEAARAGFGHDLFEIDRKDTTALGEWRERLQHELQTNESGFFRTKHKSISIPENFPDKAVLYYYKHPVVSNAIGIERHRRNIKWEQVKVSDLRKFTVGSFDWRSFSGLRHFVRVMAPALLGQRLAEGLGGCSVHEDMDTQAEEEEKVVKLISGRRNHITADNIPELRIAYVPKDVVGLDFEAELQAEPSIPETHTDIYSGDDEAQEKISESENNEGQKGSPRRRRGASKYDSAKPEKEWFPETYVKLGVPLIVEQWEAEMRDPKKFATRKARARAKLQTGMCRGAIEPFLKVKKPGNEVQTSLKEGFEVLNERLPWDPPPSLPFLPPPDPLKEGPNKFVRRPDLPLQQLSSSSIPQSKPKATKLTLPISKVPSTAPAGDYSFRASAKNQDKDKSTKQPEINFKKRPHQAKSVVLLSSPSKPDPIPFDSPQKPLPKKRTICVLENMREKKLQEQKRAQDEELMAVDLSDSSLPSPSAIFRSLHSNRASNEQDPFPSVKAHVSRGNRKVMPRESLEGSWKIVDDYGLQVGYSTPKRGFTGVEVLDLTNS